MSTRARKGRTVEDAAEVVGCHIEGRVVELELLSRAGVSRLRLPCEPADLGALAAVAQLHAHRVDCTGDRDVHVGLLLRVLDHLDGGACRLVLRPAGVPRAALRIGVDGHEIELSTLDACVLLLSHRVRVAIT